MKKNYISPEIDVVSFSINDVLTLGASKYIPDPQGGNEGGEDNPIDDL